MRSIRFSLLTYFLVLLASALGAVSLLAYQSSQGFLEDKEKIRMKLLQDQFKLDSKAESERLDRPMTRQARMLAFQWQTQYRPNRFRFLTPRATMLTPLGALSSVTEPSSALAAPVWHDLSRGPWSDSLMRALSSDMIQINEEQLHTDLEIHVPAYFQINSEWGGIWRSRSMGKRVLHFDPAKLQSMHVNDFEMDEFEIEPGIWARRATLKASIFRFGFQGQRPTGMRQPDGRVRSDRPTAPSERPIPGDVERRDPNSQAILIQFVAETSQRDFALEELRKGQTANLEQLRAESSKTLADLRNRLLLISLVTFTATVLGIFWLVRMGLSPLSRLSEAVSLVSVKDFRLPFDDRRLPSELRPIVERLVQTLDLLKRTFAREKQAAADISHDLRTPLAALLTTIEVGLRKERSPEEYRGMLSDCHEAGQQISYLVERLLALARLDAGVDTLRPRQVDVANLAEQCANLVRPLANARDLTLRVHRNGPVEMNADPDKLREIVTNFLHNAIEYNQPHGSVDLTVERQNGSLHLEVRDTGIGIAPEAREQIFERFYRVDSSRHTEGLHAGLGLAIVKGYVDLMGGKIAVKSTLGTGSVFSLELPA